uniref:Uncharacterized protein n=1 Tax=Rangifer tarandus platyrhynchus TaxID=3082113 RepID=A0ACB0E798_RANTA|nr:unnamed protein product [Rangifer tarandus platyrhynchus]
MVKANPARPQQMRSKVARLLLYLPGEQVSLPFVAAIWAEKDRLVQGQDQIRLENLEQSQVAVEESGGELEDAPSLAGHAVQAPAPGSVAPHVGPAALLGWGSCEDRPWHLYVSAAISIAAVPVTVPQGCNERMYVQP